VTLDQAVLQSRLSRLQQDSAQLFGSNGKQDINIRDKLLQRHHGYIVSVFL
jgi:hypothetical protein